MNNQLNVDERNLGMGEIPNDAPMKVNLSDILVSQSIITIFFGVKTVKNKFSSLFTILKSHTKCIKI